MSTGPTRPFLGQDSFELLSALWVIPRKRTSGKKSGTVPNAISRQGAGRGTSELLPVFSSLKERLQGSSLWLPSGEEAEVNTMGARGPSINRFRAQNASDGPAAEAQSTRKRPIMSQGAEKGIV